MKNYLNSEKDIRDIEDELQKLKDPYDHDGISEVDTYQISKPRDELDKKLQER